MRVGPAGPVREQRHRLTGPGRVTIRGGQRQRPQPVPGLAGHRQRLPAGRQHPHIITRRQQPGAQLRGRADHMLTVIQHQQQLLAGQHPRHRLGRRHSRLLPDPQSRRHHGRDLTCVLHRRQLHQPRPVREPARHPFRHLAGQPGLPRTARPGHRHQPVLRQQPCDLADRFVAADETRQRRRQPVHHRRRPALRIRAGVPRGQDHARPARAPGGPPPPARQ